MKKPPNGGGKYLTLRVLRSLARLVEAGLLSFNYSGIPCQKAVLLKDFPVVIAVDFIKGPGNSEAYCARLSGNTATFNADKYVELAFEMKEGEGRLHFPSGKRLGEVVFQASPVYRPLSAAGLEPNSGYCILSFARSISRGYEALPGAGLGLGLGAVGYSFLQLIFCHRNFPFPTSACPGSFE